MITTKEKLLPLLEKKNLDMSELAQLVGMNRYTLSRKLNGHFEFNVKEVAEFKKKLELSDEEIINIFL